MSDAPGAPEGSTSTATAARPTVEQVGGMLAPLRDTALAPMPQGGGGLAYGGGGDPLAGGVDYRRVWHAFRRRWLPATALALLLGTTAAALTWLFLPRGYEAVAWLRVRDKSGMFGVGGRDSAEFEAFRKTQVQLIKSPFVLTSALRRPGISNLGIFKGESDPVGWLTRHVQVSAPMESEVIQVRMRGEDPKEVTQVVNAVTNAYINDVVNKEKSERLARRDNLDRRYKENMAEVRKSLETYNNLAKSLGTTDSAEVLAQRTLLLDHLGTLRAQINQAERDIGILDAELAIMDAKDRGEITLGDSVSDDVADAMMLRDPQFSEMRDRLASLDESIAYQAERSARGPNDPAVKRLQSLREGMVRMLEKRREDLRPQIVAQLHLDQAGRRPVGAEGAVVLKMRREILQRQLEQTKKDFDKVAMEVRQLGQDNADLMARKQEIEQLMKVTDEMGVKLQETEIDVGMPNRVELIEEASVPEGSDELFRTLLTILAGGAGLVTGGGLVVMLEYLRDRLSSADEVSQRVGLRVLGTIPRIARSRRKPNDGHVAECVDGVRTVITQTGREAPKVILVTSAVEHEGKTTFAAQLAASLARSGKRTLLLDGDLRHPNAHLALGLDLRSGLPELLRGEIGTDDAVQPTAIDGLFAVTGGNCDYAAITALSRPESAGVIRSFRDSFDHVVIDAGPVLAFADSLLLGQQSDVAIVATMRDVSRVPMVNAAVDRLRSVGVRVLGTVVNGVTDAAPRRLYSALPQSA